MTPFEANADKPAIVLIHRAWADGSCWQKVIPILQKSGYQVVAAQLPLANFAEDVSFARRVIEGQKGRVVVVGHSYGGAIITEAAAKNANVKALVFIAASYRRAKRRSWPRRKSRFSERLSRLPSRRWHGKPSLVGC